ncbi:hypothetical protein P2O16_25110, partial [Escherichia coli]
MMSLWDALRMNMMISYQELVRTFLSLRVSHPPKIVSNDPKPIFTALSATSTHSVAICYSFFL